MTADSDTQRDIRNELVRMLSGNAGRLDVQVREGVVTLTASVDSHMEEWKVEHAVRRMPGIQGLIDETLAVVLEAPVRSANASPVVSFQLIVISSQRSPGARHASHRPFCFGESR